MIRRLKIGLKPNFMPAYIKDKERFLHCLLTGGTGAGKSSLLTNFWKQDSFTPVSKILTDPSGFLSRDCFSLVKGKVHYCSLDNPIGINPLIQSFDKYTLVDNLMEIINQLVIATTSNEVLTVAMRKILTEVTLTCLRKNRPRIDAIRDELEITLKKGKNVTVEALLGRLNLVCQDERVRKILCDENSILWRDVFEKGESFIMNCHGMTRDRMVIVGSCVSHAIKTYFRHTYMEKYPPVVFYVDECHNFTNPNWFDLLKEGRKYNLSVTLATQDFATIPEQFVKVILSNVGSLLLFRCGYREAFFASREFKDFSARDIQFQEKYHLVYKTPSEEGRAKTSRPPLVRKRPFIQKPKPRPISGWFKLKPYRSAKDYDPVPVVVCDDGRQASETPPFSERTANDSTRDSSEQTTGTVKLAREDDSA